MKLYILIAVVILIAGATYLVPAEAPTSHVPNATITRPTSIQCGHPSGSRILPRLPGLVVWPPVKEDNKAKEECPHCYEIPVVGAKGEMVETIKIHLYNANKNTFNKQDAILYFADVFRILKIHYVDGIWCSAVLAQAYTEGGAGKTGVYTHTNNLFGIRAGASWEGYVYSRSTQVVYESYNVAKKHGAKDLFRAYGSIHESIRDYLHVIQCTSYQSALFASSPHDYLKTLLKKGYGTPSMLEVWTTVIDMFDLITYDKEKLYG